MKTRLLLVTGLLASLLVASNASAQLVRLINDSFWDIHYLYLSPTGDTRWGPDQLGQDVLSAGGGWIDLSAACGYYDLRFVDEDADECVVGGIHLCNETVTISNDDLLQCTAASQ